MRLTAGAGFAIALALLSSADAATQPVQVCLQGTPLTNNTSDDGGPAVDGTNVVWKGVDGIYRWDGSTAAKIPGTSEVDRDPDVGEALVTWSGRDGSPTNDYEIYVWNGGTPIQLTNNSGNDGNSRTDGTNVVWGQGPQTGGDAIYLWNGTTTTELTAPDGGLTDQAPDVSGSTVVWEGVSGIDSKIYRWDQAGETLLYSGWDNHNPAISGSWVVWHQYPCCTGKPDVLLWNGTETIRLTNTPSAAELFPDVSGTRVVWAGQEEDGGDLEIFLWEGDTGTTYQLTCNGVADEYPRISGLRVVWQQADGLGMETEIMTAIVNPFSLTFPLPNRNPCTAEINSVFDHSMTAGYYCPDNVVTAYSTDGAGSTEEGEAQYGQSLANTVPCGNLYGFRKDLSGTAFIVNGTYHTRPSDDPSFLFYDGHPGVDYRDPLYPNGCAAPWTPILAAHDGDLIIPGTDSVNGGSPGNPPSPWGRFHTFKIVHESGWSTWYLHASGMAPPFDSLAPSNDCTAPLGTGDICLGKVGSGDHVAFVGSFGAPCHLHFEARNPNGAPVDPYGWLLDPSSDPYAYKSVDLWARTGAAAPVAQSCPGSTITPAGQSQHHLLGGSSVPGGIDVVLNEPVGGALEAGFFPTPLQDAENVIADPGSINFDLPTEPIGLWEISFEHALTTPATLTVGYDDANLGAGSDETSQRFYHYIPPFEGCVEYENCGWVPLLVLELNTDLNLIILETDGFSQFVLGGEVIPPSPWTFFGTGSGGTVDFTVGAVSLQVVTIPGQTAAQVATAVAAAINGNAALAASGITATAVGATVTTNGSITSSMINDPGLTDASPVPSLSWWGTVVLIVSMIGAFSVTQRNRTAGRIATSA